MNPLVWTRVVVFTTILLHDGSSFAESANGGCPPKTLEYGGRCIYHSSQTYSLSTEQDKDICNVIVDDEKFEANLVTVKNLQELHFFWSLASRPSEQSQYVGLFHTGSQWDWQDGGSNVTVMWADTQPVSENTDRCASISATKGLGLENKDCTTELPVTCEARPTDGAIESETCDWILTRDKSLSNPDKTILSDYDITQCLAACRTEAGCQSVEWQGNIRECRLNTMHTTASGVQQQAEAGVLMYDLYCWDDPSFGPLLYNNGRLLGNISMTASSIFDSTSDSFAADVQWGSMWRSEVNEFQWLQIDLGSLAKVEKVDLFGGYVDSCYVTSFYLGSSNFSTNWIIYKNPDVIGEHKVFQGVASQTDSVSHILDPAIIARSVRIFPKTQQIYNCLQLQLHGRILSETPTDEFGSSNSPLGFESGNIEDNQISASSFDTSVNYFFPPWQARLNNNATLVVGFQHSYWQTLANYWIQVDLITPHLISALATQGAGEQSNDFISSFKISHALEKIIDLSTITDSEGNDLVFSGNIDPDSVSLITFNETLEVRWLRLFVVTVTSKAALRMELYGQPKVIGEPKLAKISSIEDTTEGTCSCDLDSYVDDTTFKLCLSETSSINITFKSLYLLHGLDLQWQSSAKVEALTTEPLVQILSSRDRNWRLHNITRLSNDTELSTTTYRFERMQKAIGISIDLPLVNGTTCLLISLFGYKAKACPPGYIQYHSKCYTIVQGSYNLMEASEWKTSSLDVCKQTSWNGMGRMATVMDMQENYAVWNLMSGSKKAYIGHVARNLSEASNFKWTHYEADVEATWTFWHPDHPVTNTDRCTSLDSTPYWYETSCEASLMIACEVDASVSLPFGDCANAEWESYLHREPPTSLFQQETSFDGLALWQILSLCQDGAIVPNCSSLYFTTNKVYYSTYTTKNASMVLKVSSNDYFQFSGQKVGCNQALIWDNYPVQVSVDASSSSASGKDAIFAELNNELSFWRPQTDKFHFEFLQVDFHVITEVAKLALMGGAARSNCYVSKYMLMYTNDTRWWEVYKYETGEHKVFTVPWGRYFLHQVNIEPPIIARFVRFVPTAKYNFICARLELYGTFLAKLYSSGCNTLLRSSGLYDAVADKYTFIEVNGAPRVHILNSASSGLNLVTLDSELCQADLEQLINPAVVGDVNAVIHLMENVENGSQILAVTSVQLYPLAAIKEYLASIGLSRLSNYNNQAGVTYCLIASRDDPSVNRDVLANQHYGPVFLSHVWKAKKIPGIDVSLDDLPGPLAHWPMNMVSKFQDITANSLNLTDAGPSPVPFRQDHNTWHLDYAYFDKTWLKTDILNHSLVLNGSFSFSVAIAPMEKGSIFEFLGLSNQKVIILSLDDDVKELYLMMFINGVETKIMRKDQVIHTDIWNFLTFTYNAGLQLLRLYHDGKVILHTYVDLSAFADLTSQSTLYVGGSIDSVISYQGKIACLEFYDMQLTAVQVQKIIQRCRNNADQFKDLGYIDDNFPEGPLGIITRSLTPSQIKVSSAYTISYVKDDLALYSIEGNRYDSAEGWIPASHGTLNDYEFIEINLGLEHVISAVVLKGVTKNALHYADSFVMEYANQLGGWHLITESDGSNKTFSGNFDCHSAVRVSMADYSIQTQHVRLWPRGQYFVMQAEILGHPVDKELLLQMENNNGISPNCDYSAVINSYYAEVASDDYWISIDFKGVFYITSIHINSSESTPSNTFFSIQVETRLEHRTWTSLSEIVQPRNITSGSVSYMRYNFSPVLRTKYLRFHISSHLSCASLISLFGKKSPACPPGSTVYGSKCVYPVTSGKTYSKNYPDLAKSICQTYSWYTLSDFGKTSSHVKIAMFTGLMNSFSSSYTYAWLPVAHSGSKESAYWADGTSVEAHLWAVNKPASTNALATLHRTSQFYGGKDNQIFGFICETDAQEGVINDWKTQKADVLYTHTAGNSEFKVFVDGKYQGMRSTNWWKSPYIIKATSDMSVFAVELVGNGQDTPMILSLISGDLKFEYNTEREYISDGVGSSFVDIASDSSWKCSSSFEQFWTFPHFNDSHWNMSTILSNYTSGPSLINEFINLTTEPHWISVDGVSPSDTIYCRKTLNKTVADPHSCELRWLYVQGRCAPDIYQAVSYVESATECMSQCLLNTSLSCGSVDYIANAQPSCFYRKERRTELKQVFVDVTNCHYFETWCPEYDDNLIWSLYAQGLAVMSASGYTNGFDPFYGILNEESVWRFTSVSPLNYIQADLHVVVNISAITTKGYLSNIPVHTYRVFYNDLDIGLIAPIADHTGNPKMFTANWDNTKYHTEVLEKPLITNMIRINLVSYSASGVALKFDIHGTVLHEITIPDSQNTERTGLGMESKDIGATQIAMSEKGQNWQHWHLHLARLNAVALSAEYGCGLMKSSDVYMQIDLLISHKITEMAFQRCPNNMYYITKANIQHSNDNINWNTITDPVTGNDVVYDIVLFPNDLNVISVLNVTDARGIRLVVLNQVTQRGIRMELFGKPNDCPIISDIDDIENVTVNGISLGQIQSVLAMDRNDIEPLCVDDSLQTVEIYVELSHLHVLTSIEFLNGTTITAFDLQYSNDPSKWTGYQDSLNKTERISLVNSQHIMFPRGLKAYMIRIIADVSENKNCIQIQLHGCPMDVCPPQFIEHEGRCYHQTNFVGNYDEIAEYCSTTSWKGGGYMVMPKDWSQFQFVTALAYPYTQIRNTFHIGLRSVNGVLTWADGSAVSNAEALPWQSTPSTSCTYIGGSLDVLQEAPCSNAYFTFCETGANLGKKSNTSMSWIQRWNMYPNFPSYQSLASGDLWVADCMELCLKTENCKSFRHSKLYRVCQFAETPYPSGSISFTGSVYYHYFEFYVKDVCETDLLAEATSISASSHYDSTSVPEHVIYNMSYFLPGMSTFWRAADEDDFEPWVQASFALPVEVYGVRYTGISELSYYTTHLHLAYSTDGVIFEYYFVDYPTNSIKEVTSDGGIAAATEVSTRLQYPFAALHVRAFIVYFAGKPALRLSLLGCVKQNLSLSDDAPQLLGMKTGKITNSQLSSYSIFVDGDGTWNSPYTARLNARDNGIDLAGWIPATTSDVANAFVQVDFYHLNTITGLLTQGKGSNFVKSYDVHYSTDRLNWIDQSADGNPMTYTGYKNEILQTLSPNITALSVRLYPRSYQGMVLLKFELIGFPQDCPSINAANVSIAVECDAGMSEVKVTTSFTRNHIVTGVVLRGLNEFYPEIQRNVLMFSNVSALQDEVPTQLFQNSVDNKEWKIYIIDAPEVTNFTLIVTNVTECLTVEVLACELPGCPLGYATFRGTCYFYPDVEISGILLPRQFNETEANCQSLTWAGKPGSLILPEDIEMNFFLQSFVQGTTPRYFLDVVYDNATSEWISRKENVTLEFSNWDSINGFPDADAGHCAVSENGFWKSSTCDQGTQFCQVQSADEDSVDFQWIYLSLITVSSGSAYNSVYQMHVSRCLQVCEEDIQCLSVQYILSTFMCHLYTENRYTGLGLSTGSDYYYEKLSRDYCYRDLFQEVGHVFSASTELDEDRTADKSISYYWTPSTANTDQWLKVELDARVKLYELVIIGSHNSNSLAQLLTFNFQVTTDLVAWNNILNTIDGTEVFQTFSGNFGLGHFIFHDGILGKGFKIIPLSWTTNIAVNWKFLGCPNPVIFQSCATGYQSNCFGYWDIILLRNQNSDFFNSTWLSYKDGFKSNSTEEYYIGNEALWMQTEGVPHNLRVDLWVEDGTYFYSEYSGFKLASESLDYALTVDRFIQGTAESAGLDSVHHAKMFQTYDHGDVNGCAEQNGGGWWYSDCNGTSLTANQITWNSSAVDDLLLQKVIMRMMPDLNSTKLNVAIKKPVNASSQAAYGTDLLVDGNPDSHFDSGACFQTRQERDPYVIIDLQELRQILVIKVVAASDTSGNSLRDFDVKYSSDGTDISSFDLCSHYSGIPEPGEHVMVNCTDPVTAQYVALQMTGVEETLVVCEIEVYAESMSSDLNDTCYWDGDCGVTFSICLPTNPAAQNLNFTCQCSEGYLPVGNICKAYVDVLFNFTISIETMVFRGLDMNISTQVFVDNNDTTPFDFSSNGVNFNITMYLSDTEDIAQRSSHLENLNIVPVNYLETRTLKRGLMGKESLEEEIVFEFDVLTSQCPHITFLCLRLEEGANATYIDRDPSNNMVCIDISKIRQCRPDADVFFSNMTFEVPLEIVRDTPGPYIFHTVLKLNPSSVDIFEADHEAINFKLSYGFFDEGDIPDVSFFNGSSAVSFQPNITEAQKGLAMNTFTSQTLDIRILADYLQCVNISQFCVFVDDDITSSYTETDPSNNMFCVDIAMYKACLPEIELSVDEVTFSSPIIRGYNSTATLNFTIVNHDALLPVSILDQDNRNFNVSLYAATTSDTTAVHNNNRGKWEVELSLEQQQSKLVASTRVIFEGIAIVYISREECGSVTHLCVEVKPGFGASYILPADTVMISCIEATIGLNCDGLPAKDVNVILNPPVAAVGVTAEFAVSWSEGTDLQFDIDFGDGNTFQWHWQTNDHIESYGNHSVAAYNTYNFIGNYTMPLTIGNQLGNQQFRFHTLVEPVLSEYVNITSSYIPSMVPVNFEVSFTHINEIDTGTVYITCSVTWGDTNMTTEKVIVNTISTLRHVFIIKEVPDVTVRLDCSNHVSQITYETLIILRQAISGLNIISQQPAFATSVSSFFNVTMTTGSHVNLEVDFGDGATELFNYTIIETFSSVWVIEHVYASPGNYTVQVIATNEHFANATSLLNPVILQNPITGTSLTGEATIKVPDDPASFTLALNNLDILPTSVWCTWLLNDVTVDVMAATMLEQGQDEIYTKQFTRENCGVINITAVCSNLVSSYTSNFVTHVYEEIRDLMIVSPLGVKVGQNFTTLVTLANGSEVIFNVDFGDGVTITRHHEDLYAVTSPTGFQHNYSSPENFTITVGATNPVSTVEVTHDLAVQHELSNIYLSANESVLWPPGLVHFHVSKLNNLTYNDVHCFWDYGQNSTEYVYVEELLSENWHTHSFSKAFLGLTNITVNCSNLVSSVFLNVSVDIIFDRVTLDSLNSLGWVWWTNISTAILSIARFGTHSCFEWDMGDGNIYMYGRPWCEPNATKLGVELNLLSYDDSILVVNHTYETWDNHKVTVNAFNHVSNDTLTTVSVVREWYCNKPIIDFTDNYTDISHPIQFMKSWDFIIPASRVLIDCMKSLNRSESNLKVYSLGNPVPVHEEMLPNAIEFHHPPLLLDYGIYKIDIFMEMFEVPYVNTTTTLHIEIIPTPLVIKIDNEPFVQKMFGDVLQLRAIDFSSDPDLLPISEQNIMFDWACRRYDEDFPLDDQNNILDSGAADESILTASEFQGCYGGGPGKVAVKQNEYILDTTQMLPNLTYVLYLHGYKDVRTGFAEKVLQLGSPKAPEVTVSCRENCAYRRRLSGRLVVDSQCHNYCETKFGKIQYLWSLHWYDEATGENVTYSQWDYNMTQSGITHSSVFIHPFSLVGGVLHTLTLTTWTPRSHHNQTVHRFLSNLPPYGGSCSLEPSEGYAKLTLFTTNCINWREFRPEGKEYLKYEYRISSKGSTRNFLTYFGEHGESSPTVLPVGNLNQEFLNEFKMYIFDSTGDYYIYTREVMVYPENKPQSEAANEILGSLNDPNSDLMQAVAAGDFSNVATTMYSMLSVINIPPNFDNETLGKDVVLALKTSVRSAIMGLVADFPVEVLDSLEQVNELVRSVLHTKEEVDIPLIGSGIDKIKKLSTFFVDERNKTFHEKKTQIAKDCVQQQQLQPHHGSVVEGSGIDKIKKLSTFFVDERNKTFHEKKTQIAKDLIGSTIKVLLGGDYLLQASSSNSTANTTESLNSNNTGTANDTVRQEVGLAMNGSMGVVDTLSGALLEDKSVGDPDDVVEFDELSLIVTKSVAENLDNTTVSVKQGSLQMPRLADAFPNTDGSCIDNTVLFSFVNPYILDTTSDNVNTAVLTLGLHDCSVPGNRTKRSTSTGLAPFDVEVAAKKVNLLDINETIDDSTEMIVHHLNLNTHPKPVLISVFPRENSTLKVMMDFNEEFDSSNHLVQFQVPMIDKTSNHSGSEEELYELQHTWYLPVENITDRNATTLYIGVMDAGCLEDSVCEDTGGRIIYRYSLSEVQCQEWDAEKQVWSSEFCEVLPDSLPSKPKFKSNLFGSMGAGLFVGPNTINFKNVFDNLDQKLADNAAVVGTVIGVIVLYIPFVILCRVFDKRDKKKWMILPLVGNIPEDKFCYEVHVYTGIKANSETDSNVHMVVAGTNSDTGIRKVADGQRKNFRRAGVDSFLLKTNATLGVPVTIKIWHDNSGKGNKAGWYLSKIVIVDLQTSDWYLFKCENWLSAAEGDGMIERIIHSYKNDSDQSLLQTNIQKKLFDDHLWLSVGYRSTRSRFTRVQRLSVCLAILLLTMVSNAMWFGTGDSESKQVAFTFGPISLTIHQLYTSVMSSLIVVPPIVAITMIFAKSEAKQSKDIAKGALERDNSRTKKKKKRLPFWCVYVAYFLVVLSVAAGAFFTITYAFEWGKAKSEEWLVTFVLSFLQSVLLVQPIKVIIVAALLSILFKKDTDVSDFEDVAGTGLVQPDKDMKPANEDVLQMSNQLTEDEIDAAKKRQELDAKSRSLVREVAWQIIFLAILLWVIVGNQDHNVFYQNTNLKDMFFSDIGRVQKKNDTWVWLRKSVLPNLYLTETYNQLPLTAYDEKFVGNGYAMRLGPPRLRQIRVTGEECRIPQELKEVIQHCHLDFDSKFQETKDFTPDWKIPLNMSHIDESDPLHAAYIYQSEHETNGSTYWGISGFYPAGGYITNLGNSYDDAVELVNELERNHWIDDFTRVLYLEFNVWNANTNLFNLVIISFEFPASGGQIALGSIDSVNLYRYAGAGGFINLLSEVILTIFVIVLTVMEVISMAKQKKLYFQQIWNYASLVALVLFYVGFGFYVYRSILTTQTIEEMMNNKGKTINFSPLSTNNKIFLMCLGFMAYIYELRLLHILRYSRTISVFGTVITSSAVDLINVAICFGIIFFAFLSVFYIQFGHIMHAYRSVFASIFTMYTGFLGDFDFQIMKDSGGYLGVVMFLLYLLVSIYFWVNVIIAVINEYISEIQGNEDLQPKDHEVLDHLFSGFNSKEPRKTDDNKPQTKKTMLDVNLVSINLKESPVMKGLDMLLEDFFSWSSGKEEQKFELLVDEESDTTSQEPDVDADEVSLYSNLEELVILSLHMLSEETKQDENSKTDS